MYACIRQTGVLFFVIFILFRAKRLTRAHQGEAERRSAAVFRRRHHCELLELAGLREREGGERERRFVMRDVGGLVKILQRASPAQTAPLNRTPSSDLSVYF
jgi:hypothetical protein